MATFDNSQQAKLVKILRINAIDLGERLTYVADQITAEMKTEVVSLIAEWESGSVSRNTTRIKPFGENDGVDYDPERQRSIIKGEIAELLFCADLMTSGNGQMRLVRG